MQQLWDCTLNFFFFLVARQRTQFVLVCTMKYGLFGISFSKFFYFKSNDPGKVDSNLFCYAETVLFPPKNVLIFTRRMHKPTARPFTQ